MLNISISSRKRRIRKGTVAVEFALTVPVLFFLMFSAFEFSRMNMIRHSLDNAAYEGAREGIIPGATTANVRVAVDEMLRIISVREAVVSVFPVELGADVPRLTVTIAVPFQENSWLGPVFFRNQFVTRSCTLTREKFPYISES